MITLLRGLLDELEKRASSSMHNYLLLIIGTTWALAVFVVLLWPNPTRLDMAKDVGLVVLGAMGVVGGTHAYKAVKGAESSSVSTREPKPDD